VRELLQSIDDRYVIMNAGDEMKLRFTEVAPSAAGYRRTFAFMSDGWEKDGNLNTEFSKTVLPLPAHNRPDYKGPLVPLHQDPVYLRHPRDWETYHTRYVTPERFLDALRIKEN
jgi:hypothetical protein